MPESFRNNPTLRRLVVVAIVVIVALVVLGLVALGSVGGVSHG